MGWKRSCRILAAFVGRHDVDAGDMELVVVGVSGVQRFIGESRSTADLHAGSALVSGLAGAMLDVVPDQSMLVLPSGSPAGAGSIPNRIVVLAGDGDGAELAEAMAGSARSAWDEHLAAAFADADGEVPRTPGFPAIQWAVVPFDGNGYRNAWKQAQALLRARKRIRDFPGFHVQQNGVCTLTGRWPAESGPGRPSRTRVRRGESLSAVGRVKRWYGRAHGDRFASTWSISTAAYRDEIVRLGAPEEDFELWGAVLDLRFAVDGLAAAADPALGAALRQKSGALEGMAASHDETLEWLRQAEGSWCVAGTWDPSQLRRDYELAEDPDPELCKDARLAAGKLARAARGAGIAPVNSYLAVLAQDADRLGDRLGRFGGGDPVGWHRDVSAALSDIATRQVEDIKGSHLGQVVYAGGDDLLALVPAERALAAARSVNGLFAGDPRLNELLDRPTASSAIAFFHASWPLQSAIESVRDLLKDAKRRGRPGLGVAVLTRGGERARVVLPWTDHGSDPAVPMIQHLEELVAATSGPLSGRLAGGLEQDRDALADLSREWLELELARRALRHGIAPPSAQAVGRTLAALCRSAPGRQGYTDCAGSVVIARFIAGQAKAAA